MKHPSLPTPGNICGAEGSRCVCAGWVGVESLCFSLSVFICPPPPHPPVCELCIRLVAFRDLSSTPHPQNRLSLCFLFLPFGICFPSHSLVCVCMCVAILFRLTLYVRQWFAFIFACVSSSSCVTCVLFC